LFIRETPQSVHKDRGAGALRSGVQSDGTSGEDMQISSPNEASVSLPVECRNQPENKRISRHGSKIDFYLFKVAYLERKINLAVLRPLRED
jgi:hypothetical protein